MMVSNMFCDGRDFLANFFIPSHAHFLVVTVGFSSNMHTVVESDGYVEVCVEAKSDVGSLSSGGFVTFSISVTPLTAGERV